MLLYPHLVRRSCAICKKWLYNDKAGEMAAKPATKGDKPIPRPPGTPTPCQICPKIPKGATPCPENAVEISDKNLAAYWHYRECLATGQFPADPIVRRNAGLIRWVEDGIDRNLTDLSSLVPLLMADSHRPR